MGSLQTDALIFVGGSIWRDRQETFLPFLDSCGIDRAVVVPDTPENETQTAEEANDIALRFLRAYPDRVVAFCRLQPKLILAAQKELARRLEEGFKGFCLSPKTDQFFIEDLVELFPAASAYRCPVILRTENHLVRQPFYWHGIFEKYPEVSVILAGGGRDHFMQAAELAREFAQVYLEVSDLSLERCRKVFEIAGSEKVLFASGYPASHPVLERKKWELVDPTSFAVRMTTAISTAQRLFGLK